MLHVPKFNKVLAGFFLARTSHWVLVHDDRVRFLRYLYWFIVL